jgi:sec-independent protein translocase protein TatC
MSEVVASQLLQFFIELRRRLLKCVVSLVVIFSALFYFSNTLFTCLALPLLKHLPLGHELIAINIAAPIFAPMELTFFVAFVLSVPIFLYQLWGFVAPALYKHEKRLIWPLLLISTSLFYLGVAFAYFVVLPILFGFIAHTVPKGVSVSPDISQYLDFTLKLFFLFGLVFEIPVVTILLIWSGITTQAQLTKARPYIIVGAFVVGMLFGPPDVLSQTLLALPMWLLFEVGIVLSRFWLVTSKA